MMTMQGRLSVVAINNLIALDTIGSLHMMTQASSPLRYNGFSGNHQHEQDPPRHHHHHHHHQQQQQQQQQQQEVQPQFQQQLMNESQQQQRSRRFFKPSILFHALMRYNVALVSLVPWGIAIFTMIQLKETFVVAPLIITFACFFGWLMAKLVQFVHKYQDQLTDEEQVSPASDPPPYDLVVSKPPPYNELFLESSSSSPPGPSHIDTTSYPHHYDADIPKLHSCACKKSGTEPCSKCPVQNRFVTVEDSDLPSYEQALIMMSHV